MAAGRSAIGSGRKREICSSMQKVPEDEASVVGHLATPQVAGARSGPAPLDVSGL
jgi:hypothetical protein